MTQAKPPKTNGRKLDTLPLGDLVAHLQGGGEIVHETGGMTYTGYRGRKSGYVMEGVGADGTISVAGAASIGYLIFVAEQYAPLEEWAFADDSTHKSLESAAEGVGEE